MGLHLGVSRCRHDLQNETDKQDLALHMHARGHMLLFSFLQRVGDYFFVIYFFESSMMDPLTSVVAKKGLD